MDTSKRPKIAITCRNLSDLPSGHFLYVEKLNRFGADAAFVSPCADISSIAGRFDGLLIPGGRDIHPRYYGETAGAVLNLEDEERIGFELMLLTELSSSGIPVFGICYGMQIMNVFSGGALYQDIASSFRASCRHEDGSHEVRVFPNPFIPEGRYSVNTHHHQAVKTPGSGMIVAALSSDGVIEALVCGTGRFFAGVQWHPERMNSEDSDMLFKRFVEACDAGR